MEAKLEFLTGTSHFPTAKWFVPGGWLQVAGFGVSPSMEKTKDLITFSFFSLGSSL
jgi:hypothetical protein